MKNDTVKVEIDESAIISPDAKFKGNGSVVIGAFSILEDFVLLDTGSNPHSTITIDSRSKVKYGAVLRTYDGFIKIGSRTSIGEYSIVAGHGGLKLGDCVIIAGHCYFSPSNHIFSSNIPIRFQGETAKGIIINNNCWLGAQCCVLDGITVGKNVIVGAGSIITKDLPENNLCKGTPCKIIRPLLSEIELMKEKGGRNVCTY